VTYAGAAVDIGMDSELRSSEDRERVGPSRTFDIADRVGRGAGSALLSRTPRDHVRCTSDSGQRDAQRRAGRERWLFDDREPTDRVCCGLF